MELIENKAYTIIGKVQYINIGANFKNATVVLADGSLVNIKTQDLTLPLQLEKIYQFETIAFRRTEFEISLKGISVNTIESIYPLDEVLKHYDKFYRFAPLDLSLIKIEIEAYLAMISNEVIAKIVKTIYDQGSDEFYYHSAGKSFHHAYIGGLAFHTLSMLRAAAHYEPLYKCLNKDLLYGGIILHDITKISEFGGVEGEYTVRGSLVGHLTMGAQKIAVVASELGYEDREEVTLLEHIIISHHGIQQFGSLRKPQIPEALLIWHLDTIDTKLSEITNEFKMIADGDWTQAINAADRLKFYKSKIK
jgi:3'-5' exoribonuclease